jgi:methyl-branched lipid omega-hydroxylase
MTDTSIELSDMAFWGLPLADRAAAFGRLRAEERPRFYPEPVVPFGDKGPGFYALVRHADVVEASRHPEVFCSGRGATNIVDLPPDFNEYFGSMINMDDPRHARLRRIVSRAFSPRLIAKFEDDVRRAAVTIVDDLLATGPCDFVPNVAARLPLKIICDMMGIPGHQYEMVLANSNIILSGSDPEFLGHDLDEAVVQILGAGQALAELVTGLAADRVQVPADDLVSALVTANIDEEQLTSAELASFFILLVVAGNETTRTALSHALMLFTEFPEQRELLLADFENRDRGGGRGDRALRLTGPVHAADPDPGLHHERAGLPRGRQGGAVLLLGQPRRGGVRRPRTVRHHPLTEPACGIRRGGPALLPRCPPCPPGAHRHAARAADPGPRYYGRRTGPATVQLRQRHQAATLPIRRLTTRSPCT